MGEGRDPFFYLTQLRYLINPILNNFMPLMLLYNTKQPHMLEKPVAYKLQLHIRWLTNSTIQVKSDFFCVVSSDHHHNHYFLHRITSLVKGQILVCGPLV